MNRNTIIARAWDGSASNAEAKAKLLRMMREDAEVYRLVMEPFEVRAAEDFISEYSLGKFRRREREKIWTRPAAPDQRVRLRAEAAAKGLLQMRLINGRPLGQSTRPEIEESRVHYVTQATTMRHMAQFFALVQTRLNDNTTKVVQVWTEEELQKCQKQIKTSDSATPSSGKSWNPGESDRVSLKRSAS